jgi:GT2 family glycosyltransferase
MNIDVSIIIISYNTEKYTADCVRSVLDSATSCSYEIIVVDNNSSDNTVIVLKRDFPGIRVVELKENSGFSAANNIAIQQATGEYILLLNSDTVLLKDSLENLLKSAISSKYDISGPVLLNPDRTIQRSWFDFPRPLKTFLRFSDLNLIIYKTGGFLLARLFYKGKNPAFTKRRITSDTSMDYLSFACILIKREIFDLIGELDENLLFYHEDCDYGLRAAGKKILINYCISSTVIHYGGMTSGQYSWSAFENDIKGVLYIFKKHYPDAVFARTKMALRFALSWRIIFLNFGFYRDVKRIGLYGYHQDKDPLIKMSAAKKKYSELRIYIDKYV